MSFNYFSKIDKVLGYSNKYSNWGRMPRKCLPSDEREKYIIEKSNGGLNKISLRLINRYIDEYLIFIKANHLEKDYTEDIAIIKYQKLIHNATYINEKTKSIKFKVAKKWVEWSKQQRVKNFHVE